MCGGEFHYKTANRAWAFLEILSYKTYECEKIRESPSIASKIYVDNESKLPNDFVALEDAMLPFEHQLEVPLFQPPQPRDYIPPLCSYDFLLDCGVSSCSHPFNQLSFEGVSDPSLHALMIHLCFKTRDALRGDMIFK